MPFDLKLTTKEEINMFIESDDDICKLQYKNRLHRTDSIVS